MRLDLSNTGMCGSIFRSSTSQASISAASGSPLVTWQLTSASAAQLQITASIAASSYEPYSDPAPAPGPVDKPIPVYRPPVHVSIALTLTVTPAPGEPATALPVTLDAIE